MKTSRRTVIVACAALLACVSSASAQQRAWEDRGFATVNVAFQIQSRDVSETGSFDLYEEQATFTGTRSIKGGAMFDVGGGVRLWKNLGAAIAYSYFSSTQDVPITISVPHPLFFGRPRSASATAPGLGHSEGAVHIQALWVLPVGSKIDVAIGAGPSIFSVTEDIIESVAVSEAGPPYSTVNVGNVTTTSASDGPAGFNIGVDLTYRFARAFGAGFLFRYASATAKLSEPGGGTREVKVGGPQVGFGLRVRF